MYKFADSMAKYYTECYETMKPLVNLFPIEVDLTPKMLENPNFATTSSVGGATSGYEYTDNDEQSYDENFQSESANSNTLSASTSQNLVNQFDKIELSQDEKLIDF